MSELKHELRCASFSGASIPSSPCERTSRNSGKTVVVSTLEASVEHRLQIDDRRPVESLQVAYLDSGAMNGEYLHSMESDWVWPVWRTGVEHALQWVGGISP